MLELSRSLRMLWRSPAQAIISVLVLSSAIATATVVYTLVDVALYRPLPYRDPDRLVTVYRLVPTIDGRRTDIQIEGPIIDVIRTATSVFEAVEAVRAPRETRVGSSDGGAPLFVGGFSLGLPEMLGVAPQIGRAFTDDDILGGDVLVLSSQYWHEAYGADPSIIGQQIRTAERSYWIIGVMPPTFRHFVTPQADAWTVIRPEEGSDVAARLRPGLGIEAAQRELKKVVDSLPPRRVPLEFWIRPADWKRRAQSMPGSPARVATILNGVAVAVTLLLTVASANTASVFATRLAARHAESAIQLALGATPARLAWVAALEVGSLCVLSGAVAMLAASWFIRVLPTAMPEKLSMVLLGVSLPDLSGRTGLVGFGASGLTAVLCGALSAGLMISGRNAPLGVRSGPSALPRRTNRMLEWFQVGQLAVSTVLVIGATLLLATWWRLDRMPFGFAPDGLAYANLTLPDSDKDQAQRLQKAVAVIEHLQASTAESMGAIGEPPVEGGFNRRELSARSGAPLRFRAQNYSVGPNYFKVAGIPILAGRTFGLADVGGSERVLIVNESAAKRLWPSEDPIGQLLTLDGDAVYRIVGVTGDIKTVDIAINDSIQLFFPATQT